MNGPTGWNVRYRTWAEGPQIVLRVTIPSVGYGSHKEREIAARTLALVLIESKAIEVEVWHSGKRMDALAPTRIWS